MILYVNGDSHSAGAEAVNSYCFANDDVKYKKLGRIPHPDNLSVSFGYLISKKLGYDFHIDAESGSSNDRIIRTSHDYLKSQRPDLIIIGWATWERQEMRIDNKFWQFSAGMKDLEFWPKNVIDAYKNWVVTADGTSSVARWHETIYNFHLELESEKIPHLFFNTLHAFNHSFIKPYDWNDCYISPYDPSHTFYHYLKSNGFNTVNPHSYHFGSDAHQFWANYLTKIINERIITK